MQSRVEQTIEKHKLGYNCAQAIACTYCDLLEMDEMTMFRVTEGLGFGMGCMEGTCGAISGACVLAGLKESSSNLAKPDSKAKSYKLSREIMTRFASINGTTRCKDLKGAETGKVIRTCQDCIRDTAKIVEEVMF